MALVFRRELQVHLAATLTARAPHTQHPSGSGDKRRETVGRVAHWSLRTDQDTSQRVWNARCRVDDTASRQQTQGGEPS